MRQAASIDKISILSNKINVLPKTGRRAIIAGEVELFFGWLGGPCPPAAICTLRSVRRELAVPARTDSGFRDRA